jgi:hypothetical protein
VGFYGYGREGFTVAIHNEAFWAGGLVLGLGLCLGFREACGMLLETDHELHEIERQLRSTSTAIHWAF